VKVGFIRQPHSANRTLQPMLVPYLMYQLDIR